MKWNVKKLCYGFGLYGLGLGLMACGNTYSLFPLLAGLYLILSSKEGKK